VGCQMVRNVRGVTMSVINKGTTIVASIAIVCIMLAYGIYCTQNPGTDGMIFASVLGLIGAITGGTLGFNVGWFKKPPI